MAFKPKPIPAELQPAVNEFTKFWVGCTILGMSNVDRDNIRLWFNDFFGDASSMLMPINPESNQKNIEKTEIPIALTPQEIEQEKDFVQVT